MNRDSIKRAVVAGAAALTLTGAALGVAGAQTPTTTQTAPSQTTPSTPSQTTPSQPAPGNRAPNNQGTPGQDRQAREQQFLAAVASKLGLSTERLQQAMDQARQELGLPEKGEGFRGGPGGRHGFGGGLDAAAQAMNLSVDQLRQELAGKTLTQVAQARSVNPTTVANALKADANTRIDQAAAAGRIPGDQVAQAKQRAAERVDQMMTKQFPADGGPARAPRPSGA